MRKLFVSILFVLLISLSVNGTAFAWGSTGGDGTDYGQIQETAVFFNNSGAALWTGAVVILDLSGTGVTTGTTLGTYVTTTITASSRLVMGVVKIAANDQMPVVVVTKGPVDASYYSGTLNSAIDTAGVAVGTTTKAGYCVGAATNLGAMLEGPVTVGATEVFIWVNPSNSQ